MPCYKPTFEVLEAHGFRWCEITRRYRKGIPGVWAEMQLRIRGAKRIEINAISKSGEDWRPLYDGTLTDESHFDQIMAEIFEEATKGVQKASPYFYNTKVERLANPTAKPTPMQEQEQLDTDLAGVTARVLAGDPTHAVEDRQFLLGMLTTLFQGVGEEMQALYDTATGGTTAGAVARMTLEHLATQCGIPLRRQG